MPELVGYVNNIGLMFHLHLILVLIMGLVGLVAWTIAKAFLRRIK